MSPNREKARSCFSVTADAGVYVEQFSRSGYRGGLNWYRNIARNKELLAHFNGLKMSVPALYAAGDPRCGAGVPGHGPSHCDTAA